MVLLISYSKLSNHTQILHTKSAHHISKEMAMPDKSINCNKQNRKLYVDGITTRNMKSQPRCNQDKLILDFLVQNDLTVSGNYIEFGMDDGIKHSNSYFFEKEFNFTGLCLEPNPLRYSLLKTSDRRCIMGNIGVGAKEQVLEFWSIHGKGAQVSGFRNFFDDGHLKRINKRVNKNDIEIIRVKSDNLMNILKESSFLCNSYDFLSIDCEGCELEVLESIDLKLFNIIVVETNTYSGVSNDKIDEVLSKLFSRIKSNCEWDRIYVQKNLQLGTR